MAGTRQLAEVPVDAVAGTNAACGKDSRWRSVKRGSSTAIATGLSIGLTTPSSSSPNNPRSAHAADSAPHAAPCVTSCCCIHTFVGEMRQRSATCCTKLVPDRVTSNGWREGPRAGDTSVTTMVAWTNNGELAGVHSWPSPDTSRLYCPAVSSGTVHVMRDSLSHVARDTTPL